LRARRRRGSGACLSELALVNDIRRLFVGKRPEILVGIGDDAAVIAPKGRHLLATTDMMVEGIHFDLRFATAFQIGFKLISVNVSDIYAMGGEPRYALLNVAVANRTSPAFVSEFLNGVRKALARYGADLVGGDISASRRGMAFSATLLGVARRIVCRSGARVGDGVYVTGTLGDSACGLEILKMVKRTIPMTVAPSRSRLDTLPEKVPVLRKLARRSKDAWHIIEPLLRRHLLPEARHHGSIARYASAMIDVSDGLLVDLTRLCDESGVGARIYEDKVPVSPACREAADALGVDYRAFSLKGGEDYELLFTAPKGKNVSATCIGEVTGRERTIVTASGTEREFSAEGYLHFR